MSARHKTVKALLAPERLYAEYSLSNYVEYCKLLRQSILSLSEEVENSEEAAFFYKKGVEEIEVIAKIAVHQDFVEPEKVRIQYVKNDPPDGRIILPSGENISIECTSARDSRMEKWALNQMRKGRIVSFSGFEGSDIKGNENKGYKLKGIDVTAPENQEYLVEADEECDVISRQRRHIAERIEKKLAKNWNSGNNWLAVFVNEFVALRDYRLMIPTLEELCEEYGARLKEKNVEAVYFVGGREDPFMSFHPIK